MFPILLGLLALLGLVVRRDDFSDRVEGVLLEREPGSEVGEGAVEIGDHHPGGEGRFQPFEHCYPLTPSPRWYTASRQGL